MSVVVRYSANKEKPIGVYADGEQGQVFTEGSVAIAYLLSLKKSEIFVSTDIHNGVGLDGLRSFQEALKSAGIKYNLAD